MSFLTVPRFFGAVVAGVILTWVLHAIGIAPSSSPPSDESLTYRLGYEYGLASVVALVLVLAFLVMWHKRDTQT